jgi:hypothetical protein
LGKNGAKLNFADNCVPKHSLGTRVASDRCFLATDYYDNVKKITNNLKIKGKSPLTPLYKRGEFKEVISYLT